jgi:hypothetical protein
LVRRALHARKGLALDRNEAQTNEEMSDKEYRDLFDNVTDEVHPQVLRHWRTASRLRDLTAHLIRNQEESIKIAKRHRNPLTAGPSYKSRCGAVALGRTYLLPPLSSGGALVVPPLLRFHIPLIEPDRQISRIRLSDKTSRFRVQRHLQLLNRFRS